MKKNVYFYLCAIGIAAFTLAISGCMSISDSPVPRQYMPHSLSGNDIQKFDYQSKGIIGIGPVRIPEYLNRPQMVTRGKDALLTFAQFDRWAEPLDSTILRLLDQDVAAMLTGSETVKFSWGILVPVKYQVTVDVIQIESDLNNNMKMIARWSIFDLEPKELIFTKSSEISVPVEPHDYFGMSNALGAIVANLSSEVAQELSSISKKPKDN
ncbi:MAG: PqiC family protein [Candidatus Omnitrophica bacterium]|nr:PqiC family protein [Candidatus Omnitrophota bacterium]